MLLEPAFVNSILDGYSNDFHRHHSQKHIIDMMTGFAHHVRYFNKSVISPLPDWLVEAGEAAILFHDIFYTPGATDNEQRSAACAEMSLMKCGYEREFIDSVTTLILSTVPFARRKPSSNFVSQQYNKGLSLVADIIHDLDWSQFTSEKVMLATEGKLYYELNELETQNITDKTEYGFHKMRLAFLERLLESIEDEDGLYRTPLMACYNDTAKSIITKRVNELKEQLKQEEIV